MGFPLGVTIIGVLLLSQLRTRYTTPVIYLALDGLRQRPRQRFGTAQDPNAAAPAPGE